MNNFVCLQVKWQLYLESVTLLYIFDFTAELSLFHEVLPNTRYQTLLNVSEEITSVDLNDRKISFIAWKQV